MLNTIWLIHTHIHTQEVGKAASSSSGCMQKQCNTRDRIGNYTPVLKSYYSSLKHKEEQQRAFVTQHPGDHITVQSSKVNNESEQLITFHQLGCLNRTE